MQNASRELLSPHAHYIPRSLVNLAYCHIYRIPTRAKRISYSDNRIAIEELMRKRVQLNFLADMLIGYQIL